LDGWREVRRVGGLVVVELDFAGRVETVGEAVAIVGPKLNENLAGALPLPAQALLGGRRRRPISGSILFSKTGWHRRHGSGVALDATCEVAGAAALVLGASRRSPGWVKPSRVGGASPRAELALPNIAATGLA